MVKLNAKKYLILEAYEIGGRTIHPIACLEVSKKNSFTGITYQVVALKIIEEKKVYFKNVSLKDEKFKKIRNSL